MDRERTLTDLESLNFVALDFETANEQRDSLCAIGLVRVRDGAVVETWKQYVRPPELRIADVNRSIHRIEENALANAPEFPEVWHVLQGMIADRVVAMHNAEFDINVLQRTLDHYDLQRPNHRTLCTLKLAHVAYPTLNDYRLSDVCAFLGLQFRHHACDEDARVCAEIAIDAIPRVSFSKLHFDGDDLTQHFVKVPSSHRASGLSEVFADKRMTSDLLKPHLEGADPTHPFYAKRLVFTGDLQSMSRNDAAIKVQAFGADINTTISRKTQIVVMGAGAGPSKLAKIEGLRLSGVEMRIIREDEFLQLLKGSPADLT